MPMSEPQPSSNMIVDQSYWDTSYDKYKFSRMPSDDPTCALLRQHIPTTTNDKQAFELGCFPGRLLCEIGNLGYTVNGCDLTPRVETDMRQYLVDEGCAVGELKKASYRDYIENQYDLVASFGFIEHFNDYDNIFNAQCRMVKKGGFLVLQYPNFRGFVQHKLHKFFDMDNLNNHVVDSMKLSNYTANIPPDFQILYAGYYGNFDFWIHDFNKKNPRWKRRMLKLLTKTTKSTWKSIPSSPIWSPYVAIIAKRDL